MFNFLNRILGKPSAQRPLDKQAITFKKYLKDALAADFGPVRPGKPCAFMITPWMETAVPWFSIALALFYRKHGYPVALVFQDLPFPDRNEQPYQQQVIERVLEHLGAFCEIVRVSTLEAQPRNTSLNREWEELAGMMADTYLQRGPQGLSKEELIEQSREAFEDTANRVAPLFASGHYDHWVVPGGLYGFSGVYRALGAHHGNRVAFYDCGTGSLVLATDDVASHCMDLIKAFLPTMAPLLSENSETITLLAKAELGRRLLASDRYSYQKVAVKPEDLLLGANVLIPLSVFDDAAGIGKVQSFRDAGDWLEETVRWILEETSHSVVIREHPIARTVKTNREVELRVAERYKDHPRFRFVAGTDDVSTYALLKVARVVLPCASTVGVEAAALGKRVVMESSAYYSKMGFVRLATNRQDYFEEIRQALASTTPLPEAWRTKAWLCYFMGQEASFIDCDFTPIPDDFVKWSKVKFAAMADSQKVKMVIEVLAKNTPSCLVQGRHILEERLYDLDEAERLAKQVDQFFS